MSNQKKAVVQILDAALQAEMLKLSTVAERIRFCAGHSKDRGAISRYLSAIEGHQFVRYQWVRNVLETPLKKK